MSRTIERRHATAGLIAALEQHTACRFGRGEAPKGVEDDRDKPYGVVHPQTTSPGQGGLDSPEAVVGGSWQVTCVGRTVEQAEWLADRVRKVVTERQEGGGWRHPIDVDGAIVWARGMGEGGGDVTREGVLWNAVVFVDLALQVTPS